MFGYGIAWPFLGSSRLSWHCGVGIACKTLAASVAISAFCGSRRHRALALSQLGVCRRHKSCNPCHNGNFRLSRTFGAFGAELFLVREIDRNIALCYYFPMLIIMGKQKENSFFRKPVGIPMGFFCLPRKEGH